MKKFKMIGIIIFLILLATISQNNSSRSFEMKSLEYNSKVLVQTPTKILLNANNINGTLRSKISVIVSYTTDNGTKINNKEINLTSPNIPEFQLGLIKKIQINDINISLEFDIYFWANLDPGNYQLIVTGIASNYHSSSVTLEINKLKDSEIPPTGKFLSNNDTSIIYDIYHLSFTFNAYDDFLIRKIIIYANNQVVYFINSLINQSWGDESSETLFMNSTFAFLNLSVQIGLRNAEYLPNGLAKIYLQALIVDSDGHQVVTPKYLKLVDGTPPNAEIISSNLDNRLDNSLNLKLKITDNYGDVSNVEVYLDGILVYESESTYKSGSIIEIAIDLTPFKADYIKKTSILISIMDSYYLLFELSISDVFISQKTYPIFNTLSENTNIDYSQDNFFMFPNLDFSNILFALLILVPLISFSIIISRRLYSRIR